MVTLKAKPQVAMEDLAKYLYGHWRDAPITGLVMTYPEMPDVCYMLAGGEGLPPETRAVLGRAIRRAVDVAQGEGEPALALITGTKAFGKGLTSIKTDLKKIAEDPSLGPPRGPRAPHGEGAPPEAAEPRAPASGASRGRRSPRPHPPLALAPPPPVPRGRAKAALRWGLQRREQHPAELSEAEAVER